MQQNRAPHSSGQPVKLQGQMGNRQNTGSGQCSEVSEGTKPMMSQKVGSERLPGKGSQWIWLRLTEAMV
jgi:hypothetical protein